MREERVFGGRVLAPGAGFGYIYWEHALMPEASESPRLVSDDISDEISRLHNAIAHIRETLEEHVAETHAPAEEDIKEILEAHLLKLNDTRFFDSIIDRIRDGLPAVRAVEEAFSAVAERLLLGGDPYLKARAEEIRDLCQSLRHAMVVGDCRSRRGQVRQEPLIFVTPFLSPVAVLRARRLKAAAFVTSSRSFSSHGAILLRAGGIPALGGVSVPDLELDDGLPALVDAADGKFYLSPSDSTRRSVLELAEKSLHVALGREEEPLGAQTADGVPVRLAANLDHPSQVGQCVRQRLDGVDLFRTEFMVLDLGRVPDEEEQVEIYRSLLAGLAGQRVVIRTFDLGADKTAAALHRCSGHNPALGVRGLRRHLLRFPEEIGAQFRAILRAAVDSQVSILLPMVTHAGDVREARSLLERAREDLEERGVPFNKNTPLGAMVEVPSAALGIGEILPLVDFVSIGTNDLIQYLTASDRDNAEVVQYQSVESSGLGKLLDDLMTTARALGRQEDVSVCGEIASDPEGARFLVRHGIRSLSVSPGAAPAIRNALASWNLSAS